MACTFHVELDIDNDAFADSTEGEVARILRDIADTVEESGLPLVSFRVPFVSFGVRDFYGNAVGRFGLTMSGD